MTIKKVQRVLVTTGGSDPYHITPNILLALKYAIIDRISFDVIDGRGAERIARAIIDREDL